ncbi:aminopeptidase P family protein [Paracoccus sp. M683]|uniref:M24 family metallopeptidase n=1 Tax=Paracoccus sp. M683 TaxID=2594268 RepID=UPI00117ED1D3|nr:Xaa-Pro peptidase family protein [Paracoccus sp. M683]TRW95290.1 aminopeptidase P family protein [Paracoccus sp. M683]
MGGFDKALAAFTPVDAPAIATAEFQARIAALSAAMRGQGLSALWLDATASLTYYTGLSLHASERLHGALIRADGSLVYITPNFERPKLETMIRVPGEIAIWEEDEDPFALIAARAGGRIALDPAMPFGFAGRLMAVRGLAVCSAQDLIAAQRRIKSPAELAILQVAMDASHSVQQAVRAGLRPGVSTGEVADFVNAAHLALGLGPVFVAVQFGEATAYPHGVPYPQVLRDGDMVLVDLGGRLHGYHSDITRTYVFGAASERQRHLWSCEQRAQQAAFAAAQPGATCAAVDAAARASLLADGFGPGYRVPGLPHRTGHGLGLELHEEPWIVAGNQTPLVPGMCFSIEPMLCVYGECGVRSEDIVYMTADGPRWFCPPATSVAG